MDTGLHVHVYNKHPNYSRCNAGVDNSDAIAENCWKTATQADKQHICMFPILSLKLHYVLQSLTGSISTKESPINKPAGSGMHTFCSINFLIYCLQH